MQNKIISLSELKQIQLDILIKVHDFCVKNGIKYFLSYGTLIGAIRHKGYIPCDDDIDIVTHKTKELPYHPNGLIITAFDSKNNIVFIT